MDILFLYIASAVLLWAMYKFGMVGLVAVLGILIVFIVIAEKWQSSVEEEHKERLKRINEALDSKLTPDYVFYGNDNDEGVTISNNGEKLSLWEYGIGGLSLDTYEISKILELSIKVDEVEQHRIQSGDAIGRAVVGGVLFGGAGAVIGAVTADKEQKTIRDVKKISVEFLIDDFNKPSKEICIFRAFDADEPEENNIKIEKAQQNLDFLSLLYELSTMGVKYGVGLQYGTLRDTIRLYQTKSKDIDSKEERKDLLDRLSSSLEKTSKILSGE